MKPCTHDGFHSAEGRYETATKTMRYVIVCDACRAEVREVFVQQYVPSYDAHGTARS